MLIAYRQFWNAVASGVAISLMIVMPAAVAETPGSGLSLSRAEKDWLANHPDLVLAPQPEFYPFEFFDKSGNYRGVAADYIALMEKRLGIEFKVVRIDNQHKRSAAIKSNHIDIIAATIATPEIQKYMLLVRPHIVMPGVIVSDKEYRNLDALQGKKVAVVAGHQWEKLVSSTYPDIRIVRAPDIVTGLELTSLGAADALIGDMATTSYYIHREGMTDLRVVGKLAKNLELRIATRKDLSMLNGIMEKALASITEDEKAKISRQWIHLKKSSLFQSNTFWAVVLITVAVILFAQITIIVWNRTLKKQVYQRTQALNLELQRRHEAEIELQAAHEDLINSHEELKKTQLQLSHAAKMESVGRLAAGVAHEVKNPLAVIRLGLDYIDKEFKKKNKNADVLQDMGNAVRRADSVINSLLDFSRISKLQRSMNSLNKVIDESLCLVNHELMQHDIKLVKNLDKTLPEVELDPNKLQQVFVNLFMNAFQSMQNDGTLGISTYLKKITQQDSTVSGFGTGQTVVVAEVNDTGSGIENDKLEKIFDPFYTTKPVGKGTGLGLSVIKNIMDLHNGAINIINRESGGLSVILMFRTKNRGVPQ